MIRPVILCLLMMLATVGVLAQEAVESSENVAQLRQMANQAHAAGDKETLRTVVARLHELRPNNSEYMYQLVLAYATLEEYDKAFNMMVNMQRQGLSYDFDKTPDSMNLRDKKLYEYLNDLMVKAGEPTGEYQVVASLDSELGRVEAIDWDPTREAFLVGTITDGRLIAVGRDGSFRELLRADQDNGLWGIHDLVVDSERNRLWLASSATRAYSGYDQTDKGRSVVFEFELDSLKPVRRYPVPVDGLPHSLGSIVMSATGDLFMADHRLPIIYRLQAGAERLEPIFASKGLVALRGIAVSDNGENVYVADREMGIVRFDLNTGEAISLIRAETLNLGGIDGLEYVDGDLLALQNGIRPQRIMRLILDPTGARVIDIAPVMVAPADLDRPTYGTVVEGRLFFLARAKAGESVEAPQAIRIVETGIKGLQNIVPPDMQRYLEQQARQRMAPPENMPPPATEGEEDDTEG